MNTGSYRVMMYRVRGSALCSGIVCGVGVVLVLTMVVCTVVYVLYAVVQAVVIVCAVVDVVHAIVQSVMVYVMVVMYRCRRWWLFSGGVCSGVCDGGGCSARCASESVTGKVSERGGQRHVESETRGYV